VIVRLCGVVNSVLNILDLVSRLPVGDVQIHIDDDDDEIKDSGITTQGTGSDHAVFRYGYEGIEPFVVFLLLKSSIFIKKERIRRERGTDGGSASISTWSKERTPDFHSAGLEARICREDCRILS